MKLGVLEKVPGIASLISARRAALDLYAIYRSTRPLHPRHCPLCDRSGRFLAFGAPPRLDARCPSCGSLERHRLFWLWLDSRPAPLAEPIVHFAPEKALEGRLRKRFAAYRTADLFAPADLKLNLEKIDLEDSSVGAVICNHVLEHVDDRAALKELYRVIRPGGQLIASVPIIEGWDHTYESNAAGTPHLRNVHFGQSDHVRYYGRDFRDRIRAAGFSRIDEVTAEGDAVIEHGLLRGEKIFVCGKAA